MNPQLVSYAAPPLIGAFIGYLTNKIAIKMLFRPLEPWYVFGLRVPMTPGVIPAKRHELAENIGVMVGEHLLTAADIGSALSREPFQEHLYVLVNSRVRTMLDTELGDLLSLVPDRFRSYARVGLRTLKHQLQQGLRDSVRSDSFAAMVGSILEEQLSILSQQEINALLSPAEREKVYAVLDKLVLRILHAESLQRQVADAIQTRAVDAARSGITLKQILPDPVVELLFFLVREQVPGLLSRVAVMLGEPGMRNRIVAAVRQGVEHFLSSLGPMAAMAKGFLDMDNLEAMTREYLIDHEDDLAAWLQSKEIREEVGRIVEQQVEKMLAAPLANLLDRLSAGQLDELCHTLAGQLLSALRSPAGRDLLCRALGQGFEDLVDRGNKTAAEVMAEIAPGMDQKSLARKLTNEVVSMLRSQRTDRVLGRIAGKILEMAASRPLGALARLMPPGVRTGIVDYLVFQINRILLREVPGLVHSLQISRLVTAKVDSLDLLKLEGLLLSIMEEQFKYINLFGGLIGFLIGLANLIVLHL